MCGDFNGNIWGAYLMITYPPPKFEQQKAEVSQRYKILSGAEQNDASQAAQIASAAFGVPIVFTALNERYRDRFSCNHGVREKDLERLKGFCSHSNLSNDPFIVENTKDDPYFRDNPAVTNSPNIAFFAGAPLRSPEGIRFGTLCLIDTQPRTFTQTDLDLLVSIATLVANDICIRSAGRYAILDLIEAEKDKCTLYDLAMTDPLTGILNRRAFFRFTEREVHRASRYKLELATLMLDIDHFKKVNDVYGHASGDLVLTTLINTISSNLRKEDLIGRLGGEEFAIVLPETGPERALIVANKLRKVIKKLNFECDKATFNITVSIGISEPIDSDRDIAPALERSDKALYQAKRGGRDRVEVAPSFGWVLKDAVKS